MAWLIENIGTIIVVLVVIAMVTAIVCNLIKKKKNGGCSCGCYSCPMGESCPSKK